MKSLGLGNVDKAHANIWTATCLPSVSGDGDPQPIPPPALRAARPVLAAGHVQLADSRFKTSLIIAKGWEKAKARVEPEAGGVTQIQDIYFTEVMTGSEIMRHKTLMFTPVPFPYQLAL